MVCGEYFSVKLSILKFFVCGLFFLFLVSSVSATSGISYISPTLSNLTYSSSNVIYINISSQQNVSSCNAYITGNVTIESGTGKSGSLNVTSANTVINSYTYLSTNSIVGNDSFSVHNTSAFAANDEVLIIQMQNSTDGTSGKYEYGVVRAVTSTKIQLFYPLTNKYYSGTFNSTAARVTQVIKVPNYKNLTVNSGASIVPSVWTGTTGGVIAFRAKTVKVIGQINASLKGFRAGVASGTSPETFSGIYTSGGGGGGGGAGGNCGNGGQGGSPNGKMGTNCTPNSAVNHGTGGATGGGGGGAGSAQSSGGGVGAAGSSPGGYGGNMSGNNGAVGRPASGAGGGGGGGSTGVRYSSGGGGGAKPYLSGSISVPSNLVRMAMGGGGAAGGGGGGGGGAASATNYYAVGGTGGNANGAPGAAGSDTSSSPLYKVHAGDAGTSGQAGGGMIFIGAGNITVTGRIVSNGGNGGTGGGGGPSSSGPGSTCGGGGGSGGGANGAAGGTMYLRAKNITAGVSLISAAGGSGGISNAVHTNCSYDAVWYGGAGATGAAGTNGQIRLDYTTMTGTIPAYVYKSNLTTSGGMVSKANLTATITNNNANTYAQFIVGATDGTKTYFTNCTNIAGAKNSTKTNTLYIDLYSPTIKSVSPASGTTTANKLWFIVNVSSSDTYLTNTTIRLYNATSGVFITKVYSSNTSTQANFTGLHNSGKYTYNSTSYDLAGKKTSLASRNMTVALPGINATNLKHTPADISTINLFGGNASFVYNMVSSGGVVKLSAKFYYKTNNSQYDGIRVMNGTRLLGYNSSISKVSNVSNNYTFVIDEDDVYSAEYPINPSLYDDNVPKKKNLTASAQAFKIKFRFINNKTKYNFLEYMARNFTNTGTLRIFYCNKSYTTGSFVVSNNCAQIASLAAATTYDEIESANNKHYRLPINISLGRISGIVVTNTSYIIFNRQSGSWELMELPWVSQANTEQSTTNTGAAWSNDAYTINAHIHQYAGNDTLYFKGCINNTAGVSNCSTVSSDLLELGNIPPSGVIFSSPLNGTRQSRFVNITHSAASSINGYAISNYSYWLSNESFSQIALIHYNKQNKTYEWNASDYNGTYVIKARICDSNDNCTLSFSDPFNLYNNSKKPVVNAITPSNNTVSTQIPITFSCNATDEFNLRILGLKIVNSSSDIYKSNRSITSSYVAKLNNSQTWVYNFTKDGKYNWSCFAYDGRFIGNNSGGLQHLRIHSIPPNMAFIGPTPGNGSYNNISITINVSVDENVSKCRLSYSGPSEITNWFDYSEPLRQRLNITPVNDSLPSGYHIKLRLNNINIGSHFNWSRKCNDIRFANNSKSELSYWVQSCNSTSQNATIWVNIPYSMSISQHFIYMYYGNASLNNKSNASAVFNTLIWQYNWTQSNTSSCSGPANWNNVSYNDASWYSVPNVTLDYWDQGGATDGDDYIRRRIIVTNPTTSYIDVNSNDGQWVYVNGALISQSGGTCHANGAINANTTITSSLSKGENILGVHCSNGAAGENCEVVQYNIPNSYSLKYVQTDPSYAFSKEVYSGINTMKFTNNNENTYASDAISISDSFVEYNVTCFDVALNKNVTRNMDFTLDTISPVLNFVVPSLALGSHAFSYIYDNVSMTELYPDSLTVRFYNSSGLVSTFSDVSDKYINITGLANGNYYVNATGFDIAGNIGRLSTRSYTVAVVSLANIDIVMPSSGCSQNNGCKTPSCSACTYAAFNATKYQEYNVTPYGQTGVLPFYNITNNGTGTINITVALNQTAYPGVKLKISTTKNGNYERTCSQISLPTTGCMYLMDTSQHVLAINITPGQHVQGWLITDFVGVAGGTQVNRNISITPVKY